MMQNKKILLLVLVIVIVLVAGLTFLKLNNSGNQNSDSEIEGEIIDSSAINPIQVPDVPPPSLDREIVIPSSIPDGAKDIFIQKITDVRDILKDDTALPDEWIQLGIYYKAIEDYDAAIEAWVYANLLQPASHIPLHNLGDLYGYYLRDFSKGEEYLLEAIDTAPHETYLYVKLSDIYRDLFQDKVKAKAILNKGLENSVGAQDIEEALNRL